MGHEQKLRPYQWRITSERLFVIREGDLPRERLGFIDHDRRVVLLSHQLNTQDRLQAAVDAAVCRLRGHGLPFVWPIVVPAVPVYMVGDLPPAGHVFLNGFLVRVRPWPWAS